MPKESYLHKYYEENFDFVVEYDFAKFDEEQKKEDGQPLDQELGKTTEEDVIKAKVKPIDAMLSMIKNKLDPSSQIDPADKPHELKFELVGQS